MKKLCCACLAMTIALVSLGVPAATATELLVCVLDKKIEENRVLPGGNFALPGSRVRCSMGVGDEADTFEATLQVLGKNNWSLVSVVKEEFEGSSYGIYYFQR